MVLTFESVDKIPKCDIQMKASGQYFPVALLHVIMLYRVVLIFESVDKILSLSVTIVFTQKLLSRTFLGRCL